MKNRVNNMRSIFMKMMELYRKESLAREAGQYRLIEVSECKKYIEFQIAGTANIIKSTAEEVMCSSLLMGFSKADIVLITHLGTKSAIASQEPKPKLKLFMRIAQQLFGISGKTKFLLKMPSQDELVEAIPEEVMCNKEALNMLEGSDAAMVGYAAAENRMMDIRKQANPIATCHIIEHNLINNIISYIDEERETKHALPLNDIFNNKTLFNLFGKVDQHIMSFVAGEMHQQRLQSRTKIAALRLSSYLSELAQFTDLSGNAKSIPFQELAFEAELLDQFSQQDRDMIRFAAGEFSAQEKAKL